MNSLKPASQFHVCSIQFFGWPFCTVFSISFSGTTTVLVNSGDSIILNSEALAYYDPINLLKNNLFCSLKLKTTLLLLDGTRYAVTFSVNTTTMKVDNKTFSLMLNGGA